MTVMPVTVTSLTPARRRRTVFATAAAVLATSAALSPALAESVTFDCLAEPAQRVQLGSPVTGLLAQVLVGRGDAVEKGDVLARLDSTVEQANVALAEAQAGAREALEAQRTRHRLALAALERARRLVTSGSVTQSRVEELEAAVEIAGRDVETELLRLRIAGIELERQKALLARQSIASPIRGFVMEQTLRAGEFVRQDSPILTLVQTDPLFVETYAPVAYWGRLAVGDGATVSLEQPAGTEVPARVAVIDPVFDAASGTFGVRFLLPNGDGAIPAGQRCRVRLDLTDAPAAQD